MHFQIFDGPDDQSPSMGRFCSSKTPAPFISLGNSLTIVYNSFINWKWKIRYERGKIILTLWRLYHLTDSILRKPLFRLPFINTLSDRQPNIQFDNERKTEKYCNRFIF